MQANETEDDARELVSLTRLNYEPIVILGLNRTEVMILIGASLLLWLPVCQTFAALQGRWQSGIPLGLGFAVATIVVSGVVLARIKRNRPEGYYQQIVRLRLEDAGLYNTHLIRREGVWDIRHHQRKPYGLERWRSKIS